MWNESATLEQLGDVSEDSPGYYSPDQRVSKEIPKCRIVEGGVTETAEGPTLIGDADTVMFVPGEAVFAPGDFVVRQNGRRYQVVGSHNPSRRSVYTKVFMAYRQGGNG